MKKLSLTLAILGSFGITAQAQTSVDVYGLVDLSLAKTTGTTNSNALIERNNHTSRLGFKGVEPLGGGVSVVFSLESEFAADTGAATATLFNRQANVGLTSDSGNLKLGRTKGLVDGATDRVDPFVTDGIIGDFTTPVLRAGKISQSRVSNSLTYNSPKFEGFSANAQYILSEINGAKAGYALLATYDNGPISAHAGYEQPAQTSATSLKPTMYVIGGGYQFGPAKITAAYSNGDPKTPATGNNKGYLLGLNYAVGTGNAKVVYAKQKNSVKDTVKEFGLGYDYHMSKRTDLYAYLGREQVTGGTSYQFGLSHKF